MKWRVAIRISLAPAIAADPSAFIKTHHRLNLLTRDERRPHTDDLARAILMRDTLAGHRNTGDRHTVDLAADLERFLAGLASRGYPHRNLIGLRLIGRRHGAVNCIQAQEFDAHFLGLQPDDLEALLEDALGQLSAAQRTWTRVEKHILADEAFHATNRYLQRLRARLAGNAAHPDAIAPNLLELCSREVDHHIGRYVVPGIVDLIEHLLFNGLQIDRAASTGDFGNH